MGPEVGLRLSLLAETVMCSVCRDPPALAGTVPRHAVLDIGTDTLYIYHCVAI